MICIDLRNPLTDRLNCDPGERNLVESVCGSYELGRAAIWDSLKVDTREGYLTSFFSF